MGYTVNAPSSTCNQLCDQQGCWNKQILGSPMALFKWLVLLSFCQALVMSLLSVCLSDFAFLRWGWCWGAPITGFFWTTCAGETLGWKTETTVSSKSASEGSPLGFFGWLVLGVFVCLFFVLFLCLVSVVVLGEGFFVFFCKKLLL